VIFRKSISAKSIVELVENLNGFLRNPCSIEEDENGNSFILEQRQLFDTIDAVKVELYAKEHAPPHFHIKGNDVDASFTIEDCKLLQGKAPNKVVKKVKYWHKYARPKLIEFWNETRPYDCPVGPIKT